MKLDALRSLTQNVPDLQGAQLQKWLQERLLSLGLDPNAIYQELEMTSRFVDTHRDTSYSNTQMQLHSHTFYELLYCINSCGAEYLVGSERYRLQQGDLILLPPGVSHRPLLPGNMEAPYMRYVIWLSPEFMSLYAGLLPCTASPGQSGASMLRTGGSAWESIGELFQAGVQEAEKKEDGWEAAVIGNTLTIFANMKRIYIERSAGTMKAERPELLDRVAAYIEKNYTEHITIDDLARCFFVSNSTISHLFKQKMGVSVYRYITQRRLIAAKSLIGQKLPMEEISQQVGFSDYSTFYRAFKQEFGISPRQFAQL